MISWSVINRVVITLGLLGATPVCAQGPPPVPSGGVKTNVLYDATSTINLGAEFWLGGRISLDLPFNYNAWDFRSDRKWRHFLAQPGLRWWHTALFEGSFFGVHAHYAHYNVGHLSSPPFSDYMNTRRVQGWLAGMGVSWGRRWNFSRRWGAEIEVGIGYVHLSYDKYGCLNCNEFLGTDSKSYIGPTKAALSLIYSFGRSGEYLPAKPLKSVPLYTK